LIDTGAVRMATDALGRLFVSNGEGPLGRFYCFEADLTPRWNVAVPNINIGAPALGQNGALVVAGTGTDLRVFRSPLAQDQIEISVAAGGTQALKLHAPASAGKTYWVVGSASGTGPGLTLGAVVLPLNFDPYMLWTINHPNTPVLASSLGTLDGGGDGAAQINVPAGAPIAPLPLVLNHAFVVVDFITATASFASNPSELRLVP
jgi:hypothetical protein